jgi:hypothetical protein
MKKIQLATISLVLATTFSGVAQAKNYLSFDLGKITKQEVKKQLKAKSANFESNYGYKGYSVDLPIFKINSYAVFGKYGTVKNAWLHFTPQNVLYKISVTYADSGSTYKVFTDSLTSKYGSGSSFGGGFNRNTTYQDGDVKVTLARNEFGFGSDQKTTLSYEFRPALSSVKNMRSKIEQHIAAQNAKKAAADL